MIESNGNPHDIDKLVERAFRDDVPPTVRARLHGRLQAFERQLIELNDEDFRTNPIQAWFHSAMGKLAFAVASIGFIALTFVVHEFGPKSVFACTIESIQDAAASMDAVRRAESMRCEVRLESEQSAQPGMTLRWVRPGRIRLDYSENGDGIDETWWMEDERLTILARKRPGQTQAETGLSLLDPILKSVMAVATPNRLVTEMIGPWNEIERVDENENAIVRYSIGSAKVSSCKEISIDDATKLPMELRLPVDDTVPVTPVLLQFAWNMPFDSESMELPDQLN